MFAQQRGRIPRRRTAAIPALLALALTACAGGDRAGDTTAATAAGQPAAQSSADADIREIENYRLTMDKVDRYYAASLAYMRTAPRAASDTSEDEADDALSGDSLSIDQMVAQMERMPGARREFEKAGLSLREGVVLGFALAFAMMADQVLTMNPSVNADSLARESHINPANIRFVREHAAKLKAKQQEMQALGEAAERR